MVSWIIPIVRQSKTDLIHRQEMRPLRHGGSHFVNLHFTKWLPPWRKGRISCLWIKSVFDCLTIGIIHETMVVHMTWVWTFFNNYSNHPRMCVLSTLCGNVDKHSPFDDSPLVFLILCSLKCGKFFKHSGVQIFAWLFITFFSVSRCIKAIKAFVPIDKICVCPA